jgi:hypothetical protein
MGAMIILFRNCHILCWGEEPPWSGKTLPEVFGAASRTLRVCSHFTGKKYYLFAILRRD